MRAMNSDTLSNGTEHAECSLEEIVSLMRSEFGDLAQRFYINQLSISDCRTTAGPELTRPGVYVWRTNGRVMKIGRSFQNARKRALDHPSHNTGG
jgi:hypothetical protein